MHFWDDLDAQKQAMNDIDDYLYDEVKGERGIDLSTEQMDEIIEKPMQLARHRMPGRESRHAVSNPLDSGSALRFARNNEFTNLLHHDE